MNILPFTQEPSFIDKAWMAVRYPYDLVRSPVQAIASIPALSLLVIPAFSSYGTSINLLFFYMTWAILIRSNDPIRVEFLGTLGVRILFYILPSLGFLLFDSATPNLSINMKEHEEIALPMSEENGGRKGRWWKVTLISIGNVLLGVALQLGIELLFTQALQLPSLLKVSTVVPLPWGIAKDLLLGLVLREVLTYFLHRFALHSKEYSSRLTKMHTSWQHSLPAPFSLVAHYDHPLTYLIHVWLPMYIPAVLLRMHLLTFHLYLALVSLEETFAYSGYNVLPSAFILGGMARRQEKHLMGNGNGNFGCFGLADFALGTSLGADLVDEVIDETEKQGAKKSKGMAKAAGKKARGKKKAIEPAGEEKEDETPEEEEEEKPQRKPRKNSRKSSDEERKRKSSSSGRRKYRSEDEDEDAAVAAQLKEEEEDGEEEEQPKPKRKPPKLGPKGSPVKKSGGRPRKRSGDDD
ncbi:hypothetical protein P7C71_g3174, partial [Lecanoromycetidae sp. Uapishka_2]